MKRKITGVCLAIAVAFGTWCGIPTFAEPSVFLETGQITDENYAQEEPEGNGKENEENKEIEDGTTGMEDDEDEIIVDESGEDETDLTEEETEDESPEEVDVEIEDEEGMDMELEPEGILSDGTGENPEEPETADPEAMVARATSSVPVQWVDADYQMRSEYAFTYAFRENTTRLTYISRHSTALNTKLHNWFGDSRGFTEEYCTTFYAAMIDADTHTEPITAIYSNVGEYQGKIVDLKVTAVQWGTVNTDHVGENGKKITPCVLFYKDKIAVNTICVSTVRFRFDFLDHATQKQIYPKGHVTVMDIDSGQGIRMYDNWGVNRIYLRKGYDYLTKTTGSIADGSIYNEIKSPERVSTSNDEIKAWCQLDFDGSFTLNWNAQLTWKTSTAPQRAFFVTTGKSIGTYEPNPEPEKKAGDDGADYTAMTRHEFTESDPPYAVTAGKNFDYVIAQRLLPGSYSSFVLKDTLDSCLIFRSGSVTTSLGKDVTDRFRIQNTENTVTFTADTAYLKMEEAFNDVTYYFRIKVTAGEDDTIEAHGHYIEEDGIYTIENKASRTIISDKLQDTKQTNSSWIKGDIPKPAADGQITVIKRIKEKDIVWAHGNPVFRFYVTGTDKNGISHAYEDFVEFRQDGYTRDGEYAVMSCVFRNLPTGVYTIGEKKTLRYVFESITAQTANVKLNNRSGIVELTKENKEAAVTFTNKKTKYDRYSHTDVVRNQIPLKEDVS